MPEYFLAMFPRHGFPRVRWSDRPPELPDQVWLSDTTHRDGQQGGLPLDLDRSSRIYDVLCAVTRTSGAIRQAEFFAYHEADRAALAYAVCRHQSGAPVQPTTWIRALREDVRLIVGTGVTETGLLCSASDYHTFHKFHGGRRHAVATYLDAVAATLDAGIRPRVHFEDTTRAPVDVVRYVTERVLALAAPYGPALSPRFRVCDTMGIGLPYDDVELPRSIPRWIRALREMGLTADQIEFHPHNDMAMVVANSLAAIRAGCGVISGTCLGVGERTGNAPLEAILVHLIGMGYWRDEAVNLRALQQLVTLYEDAGVALAAKYPLFGRDAFVTRAGIHADGLNKFWWMYAPFNAPLLLGRELDVVLTRDSGRGGVLFVLRRHLDPSLAKDDPRVGNVARSVEDQFATGRMNPISWPELEPVVRAAFDAVLAAQ